MMVGWLGCEYERVRVGDGGRVKVGDGGMVRV